MLLQELSESLLELRKVIMTKGSVSSSNVLNALLRQWLCFLEASKAVHPDQNIIVVFVGVEDIGQASKAGAELPR